MYLVINSHRDVALENKKYFVRFLRNIVILIFYLLWVNGLKSNVNDSCLRCNLKKIISIGHIYSFYPEKASFMSENYYRHGINFNFGIRYYFLFFNIVNELYPTTPFGMAFKSTFNNGVSFRIPETSSYFTIYSGFNFYANGSRSYKKLYFKNDLHHFNPGIQFLFKIHKRIYYQMDIVLFRYYFSYIPKALKDYYYPDGISGRSISFSNSISFVF